MGIFRRRPIKPHPRTEEIIVLISRLMTACDEAGDARIGYSHACRMADEVGYSAAYKRLQEQIHEEACAVADAQKMIMALRGAR